MARPKKVKKDVTHILLGNEPMYEVIEGRGDANLTKALNWYNYMYDDKQSSVWLLQWMKQNKFDKKSISTVKSAPTWAPGTTSGWIARMSMNGTKFAPENIQYLNDKVKYVLERFPQEIKEPTKKITIQDKTKSKLNSMIVSFEEELYEPFLVDNDPVSVFNFLHKHEISETIASQLREHYRPQFDEIFDKDPQVKEAFGKSLKRWQSFWKEAFDDFDRYISNKKVVKVRKPREKKQQPIGKIVEKLQLQKEFAPLKLVSANPQTIVGAQQLWTFNTKTRILSVFYAENSDGFSVKGTTLIGWNVDLSTSKRLRKPEEVLTKVLSAGKVAIKKIIPDLTTTEIKVNGRINKDTILLRVMR